MRGGGKERACEGVVEGGDRDEHHGAGGPDVEVVRGYGEGGIRGVGRERGDPEFAPEGVDVGLGVVDPRVFHHVIACCGVGPIGADEEVEIYGDFCWSLRGRLLGGGLGRVLRMISFSRPLFFEPGCLFVEIGACEFVVEMQGYILHFLQGIQEAFVEKCTVDGEDALLRSIRYISYSGRW